MDALQPLLGTTLILMAHPDDEIIICGGLMQRMKKAIVVFATDGAPYDEHFWKAYGSREAYSGVRRKEAAAALAVVGAQPVFLVDRIHGGIADQELFRQLGPATAAFEQIVAEVHPDSVLVPAYEGGHPDHDAACFVGSVVGRGMHVPLWEAPLYHRGPDNSPAVQSFTSRTGLEIESRIEGEALAKKTRMFAIYKSQNLALNPFHPDRESFRPIADYDFTVPPLPWKLNYEHWEWKMNGREVSSAFASHMNSIQQSASL